LEDEDIYTLNTNPWILQSGSPGNQNLYQDSSLNWKECGYYQNVIERGTVDEG